jgi:cell division protein FtsA
MARGIITGIDIGSYSVKVVIARGDEKNEKGFPKVIGTGIAEGKGLRHGYIIDMEEAVSSIKKALAEAEKKAQVKVKKAFVSINGIGLGSLTSTSSIIIYRGDSEITSLDIKKAQDQCEKDIPASSILNKKIIHNIPLQYKIDGKVVLGKPEGMKGTKLEVKTLYITCLEQQLNDTIQAVEEVGITVEDVMASPIALSFVTLSKSQKIAGCVLANIGSETTSISVFENNTPVSMEVFPIGGSDITNDIALGIKVPIEEAEQIKIGAITGSSYSRKKLEEIVEARLSDIFELIESHLKKLGRNGLLPAGIILSGGGSMLSGIEDLAKDSLSIPARIGSIELKLQDKNNYKDMLFGVAYGLCVLGINIDEETSIDTSSQFLTKTGKAIATWIKQFLP